MRKRRFISNDEGSVAVEFAMISAVFLSVMFGIIEVGRAFWTYNTLQYAVEATARYYLTHTSASDSDLSTYAAGQMGVDISTSPLTVTVKKSTVSGINVVEIDGDYLYNTIVPGMPSSWSSLTLHTETQMPTP